MQVPSTSNHADQKPDPNTRARIDKGDSMNNGRSPAAKALRKARVLYDDSSEMAWNGASHAKRFIHHRPVLSTLLGMGLGVLIGHWLRPRE